MGQSKRIFQEEQWDAWEHYNDEEENFIPMKPKKSKVRKMKKEKAFNDKKRK